MIDQWYDYALIIIGIIWSGFWIMGILIMKFIDHLSVYRWVPLVLVGVVLILIGVYVDF